jgi:putative sterol carrier protein
VINDAQLTVHEGLVGTADVVVSGDGAAWLGVVAKERSPVWAVVRGALRIRGRRALLDQFAACFPR